MTGRGRVPRILSIIKNLRSGVECKNNFTPIFQEPKNEREAAVEHEETTTSALRYKKQ